MILTTSPEKADISRLQAEEATTVSGRVFCREPFIASVLHSIDLGTSSI